MHQRLAQQQQQDLFQLTGARLAGAFLVGLWHLARAVATQGDKWWVEEDQVPGLILAHQPAGGAGFDDGSFVSAQLKTAAL